MLTSLLLVLLASVLAAPPDSCTFNGPERNNGYTLLPEVVSSMNGTLEGTLECYAFQGHFVYYKDDTQSALFFFTKGADGPTASIWIFTTKDPQFGPRVTKAVLVFADSSGSQRDCIYVEHPLPLPIPFIAVCADYQEMLFNSILQGTKRRFDNRCYYTPLSVGPSGEPQPAPLFEASVFIETNNGSHFPTDLSLISAPTADRYPSRRPFLGAFSRYHTLLPGLSRNDTVFDYPSDCRPITHN